MDRCKVGESEGRRREREGGIEEGQNWVMRLYVHVHVYILPRYMYLYMCILQRAHINHTCTKVCCEEEKRVGRWVRRDSRSEGKGEGTGCFTSHQGISLAARSHWIGTQKTFPLPQILEEV